MRVHGFAMLATLVAGLTGCSDDESADLRTDQPRGIKPRRHPPPGPYVIGYDCSHRTPDREGGNVRNVSVDLEARRRIVLAYRYAPGATPPSAIHAATPISDTEAHKLEAAVAHVLRGGPYQPEPPTTGGTPCILSLSVPGATPFFRISKARTEQPDAVSELVRAL